MNGQFPPKARDPMMFFPGHAARPTSGSPQGLWTAKHVCQITTNLPACKAAYSATWPHPVKRGFAPPRVSRYAMSISGAKPRLAGSEP